MPLLVALTRRGSVVDRLKQILGKSQDLQPLVFPARAVLVKANRDRALKGEGWQGHAYTPLAQATLKDRARKGFAPGPILVRHGEDADVIKGCMIAVGIERGMLRFTKHFEGTTLFHIAGGRKLPVRDPLGWNESELAELRKMVPRHLLGHR